MRYFSTPWDQRCHDVAFNSPQGAIMDDTSILLDDSVNLQTLLIIQHFAEVEDCDPRLMLIIGYARIHTKIRDLIDQHVARQTNGRKPNLFKTQTSALRRAGVLEPSYFEFLRLYARVRNGIAHRITSRRALTQEPYQSDVLRLHELSSAVRVWPESVSPTDDLRRCVFALSIAGCLAIELDFDGQPRGFDALAGRVGYGV